MLEQDAQLALRQPGAGSVTTYRQGRTATLDEGTTAHGGSFARKQGSDSATVPPSGSDRACADDQGDLVFESGQSASSYFFTDYSRQRR